MDNTDEQKLQDIIACLLLAERKDLIDYLADIINRAFPVPYDTDDDSEDSEYDPEEVREDELPFKIDEHGYHSLI